MIKRCYDSNSKQYKNYGGRGVRICDDWHIFANFEKWYDENYIDGYEIDKDKLGNGLLYSPETCCFLTKNENIIYARKNQDYSYMKGTNHPMYGKHLSEETKKRMSESLKGKKRSIESRLKQSMSIRGENHHYAKTRTKEYYETHSTTRHNFKDVICKNKGWNFCDFEEIFAEWYLKPNGTRERKYYYKNIIQD